MDKSYVEQYGLLENNHWWFIVRQKIILQALDRFIPPEEKGTLQILNVGAAAGGSSNWLSALGNVISLENDLLFLSYLKTKNLVVVNASVTDIPMADNSFDLVCAFDVIEHVENDQKAVDELIRVCKPGGKICITVPALQSLWGNHDVINGHKRRYNKKQLQSLFYNQGATILYSSFFNSLLFLPVFLFRKIQPIFKKKSLRNDSDFSYFNKNIFVNRVLKLIFGTELLLLRSVTFPIGVSLLMLIQKKPFFKDDHNKIYAKTDEGQ